MLNHNRQSKSIKLHKIVRHLSEGLTAFLFLMMAVGNKNVKYILFREPAIYKLINEWHLCHLPVCLHCRSGQSRAGNVALAYQPEPRWPPKGYAVQQTSKPQYAQDACQAWLGFTITLLQGSSSSSAGMTLSFGRAL